MTIGEFLKRKLEETYSGEVVNDFLGKPHQIHSFEVKDGGVDPQWEISAKTSDGKVIIYCSFVDDELPKIL
jgi:hypothetical protein